MSGELGQQLEKLAADFNASQSEYRIVPSYKGNYTETMTAAIFAFRSHTQPAIVQVNEIATATMMAAKGAIYPVYELMRDQKEAFRRPPIFPPSAATTPMSPATCCRSRSTARPRSSTTTRRCSGPPGSTRRSRRKHGRRSAPRRKSCAPRARYAASPPRGRHGSMSRIFPRSTICRWRPGPTASAGSTQNSTSTIRSMVRHIAQLAEWQTTRCSTMAAAATTAEPRFQNGECGIFIGSSATRADIMDNRSSRSATACCRTGRTSAARRKTPPSAAPRYGCCAAGLRPSTTASRNSLPSCRSRKCRPDGTRTPAICR